MQSSANSASASIAILRKLIAFPTVSRDSNLELIQFVRDYLSDIGAVLRLTYDDERRKANLFATLGPLHEPGIVLSGHTDVVPVDGQAWDTDPFTLVEKDGFAVEIEIAPCLEKRIERHLGHGAIRRRHARKDVLVRDDGRRIAVHGHPGLRDRLVTARMVEVRAASPCPKSQLPGNGPILQWTEKEIAR